MGAKRIQPGVISKKAKDRNMRKGKRLRACDTFNNKKGMVSLNSLSKVNTYSCDTTVQS